MSFSLRRVIVVTNYIHPPIPTRNMDWQATLDGYEPGDPVGHGKTEAEAVMDLYEQLNEREAEEEDDQERAEFESCPEDIRNDPHSFYDWQRKQNEGAPLRAWAPPQTVYEADDGYNAAQGPKFNPNGWGRS